MWIKSFLLLSLTGLVAWGCAEQQSSVDFQKPISQIKQEMTAMSAGELEGVLKAYASEIEAKKADIDGVKAKLKAMSPKDFLGDEAKQIKAQVAEIGQQIRALTQRYEVYAYEFKNKGGDLSVLE